MNKERRTALNATEKLVENTTADVFLYDFNRSVSIKLPKEAAQATEF